MPRREFQICNRLKSLSLTLRLGKFLNQEVERLLWSVNDKLLQEIFEEFVDLVVFEVALDRLHVLKLLELVHFLIYFFLIVN